MTKEELAKKLDGKNAAIDISEGIVKAAKDAGLVIIYGASDDLMELEGAISDEGGCYEGGEFLIDKGGLLPDRDNIDDDDELEEYFKRKKKAKKIYALWFDGDSRIAWTYKTTIPHATFNVMEDDGEDVSEIQCRGIVFSIYDL